MLTRIRHCTPPVSSTTFSNAAPGNQKHCTTSPHNFSTDFLVSFTAYHRVPRRTTVLHTCGRQGFSKKFNGFCQAPKQPPPPQCSCAVCRTFMVACYKARVYTASVSLPRALACTRRGTRIIAPLLNLEHFSHLEPV